MDVMRRAGLTMVLVVGAGAGLVACGDDSGGEGAVGATLSDFEIDLDESSAPAGEVTFEIQNDGPSEHEFVVFQTDLAEDALPTDDEGTVEEGGDLEPVDEVEEIADGDSADLTVDLEAGSYVIICNVPTHYGEGMHTSFTVE
jgi:uncharacterized cupredoxin-like copper-binding protein